MFQKVILFSLIIFLNLSTVTAQSEKVLFVNKKPKYEQHKSNYILNQITYTEKYIILKFTYVCDWSGGGCYFFGTESWEKWFLEDTKTKKKYDLVEIRNIRKDGKLLKNKTTEEDIHVNDLRKGGKASCEICFKSLPKGVKEVNLIEGDKAESNNFHCLNIQVKSFQKEEQEAQAEY